MGHVFGQAIMEVPDWIMVMAYRPTYKVMYGSRGALTRIIFQRKRQVVFFKLRTQVDQMHLFSNSTVHAFVSWQPIMEVQGMMKGTPFQLIRAETPSLQDKPFRIISALKPTADFYNQVMVALVTHSF